MRMLKAIVDHVINVPRIARKLVNDPEFVYSTGLDAVPPSRRVQFLSPSVGFVISMYESAKMAFKSLPHLTDEHVFAELVLRRLQGLPHIRDPRTYTFDVIGRAIVRSSDWEQLSREEQFRLICRSLFAEEQRGMMGTPIDVTESSDIFEQLFEAISQHRKLTLGRSAARGTADDKGQ